MRTLLIRIGLAALLLAGCRGGGDATSPGASFDGPPGAAANGGPSEPPPAPPVPASEQLLGVWEHVSDVGGTEVRLGLTFTDGALVRSTGGFATAHQTWSIVAESDAEVTADVTDADGRVARHTWQLVGPEELVHTATPDVVFRRIGDAPPPPPSGSGSGAVGASDEADEGSTATAP